MLDIPVCRGLTASKRRANSQRWQGGLPASFLTLHEDGGLARAALDASGLGYVAYSIKMILDHPRSNAALRDHDLGKVLSET